MVSTLRECSVRKSAQFCAPPLKSRGGAGGGWAGGVPGPRGGPGGAGAFGAGVGRVPPGGRVAGGPGGTVLTRAEASR